MLERLGRAEFIKDVTITTSAIYASTYQSLNARYNNLRLIINKHLISLVQIMHMSKKSAIELDAFVHEVQLIRALMKFEAPG